MEKEFFAGWGSLALVIASLAEVKNRDFWGWLILGLLFGPVALFFQAMFCDKLPEKE